MAITTHILERPPQFQFDADSAPCQSSNCKCTSGAMIAGYYRDAMVQIHEMRNAQGYSVCIGTTPSSLVMGLRKFGVTAAEGKLSPTEIKAKLNRKIPVEIIVLYSKIPDKSIYKQDMRFNGPHSVLLCKTYIKNNVPGVLVRDPDRWGSGEVNYVFWPDTVWIPAYKAAYNGIAVWPMAAKVTTAPIRYKLVVTGKTPIYRFAGSVIGYVSSATYTVVREALSGAWYYRIISTNTTLKGRYIKSGTGKFTVTKI